METSGLRHVAREGGQLPVYLAIRFLSEMAAMALSVAIGWTVYRLSNAPLALGIVGIVQFFPMLLLTLPAGELSDRLSPRRVLAVGLVVQCLCSIAFLSLSITRAQVVWPFYVVLLMFGAARAFVEPAGQALLPSIVQAERLPKAIGWSSSVWQTAVIVGPVLGGLAFGFGEAFVYGMCGIGFIAAALGTTLLAGSRHSAPDIGGTIADRIARVCDGIAFIWSRPIVLGAISLDLFAVLFGGATTLLPIYARDILHVGPSGLGLLRSAPAIGACLIALLQTRYPPSRHVGLVLFAAVAVFGAATLVFAVSTSFVLSLVALFVLGVSDMVSVNIRMAMVQLATPEAMLGRVSAVNMLFVGASSELGSFESGLAAAFLGVVPAVALGGIGTLIVAAVWMVIFPALRTADRLAHQAPD
jgi:MFS family permease